LIKHKNVKINKAVGLSKIVFQATRLAEITYVAFARGLMVDDPLDAIYGLSLIFTFRLDLS